MDIAGIDTNGDTGKILNYGGKAVSKRCDFRRFLKEMIEGADRISSGRAFQIAGASKARLLLNCFFDVCTGGQN